MTDTPERLPKSGRTRATAAELNATPRPRLDPAYQLTALLRGLPQRLEEAKALGLPEGFYTPATKSSQVKGLAWVTEGSTDSITDLKASSPLPAVGDLHVIFQGNGDHWKYAGVPRAKVLGLLGAPSAGSYFASEVRNHPAYVATKVSARTPRPAKPEAQTE